MKMRDCPTRPQQTQMVVYGAQPRLSARVDFIAVAKTLKTKKSAKSCMPPGIELT